MKTEIEKLKKYGLSLIMEDTLSNGKRYVTSDYPDGLVLSFDAEKSDITPQYITVSNVDELRDLCGPEEIDADEALYAGDLPLFTSINEQEIDKPFHPFVCKALNEYVYGNPAVVESWKDTINTLRFPMQVAIFTASEIVVNAGKPLKLGENGSTIGLICNSIVINEGGRIISMSTGKVSCNTMVSNHKPEFTGKLADSTLSAVSGDGGVGGAGGPGGNAGDGAKGADTSEKGEKGGNGKAGLEGACGSNGADGGRGGDSNSIVYSLKEMRGHYLINSVAGNGGNGGNGGKGGDGGNGGKGGTGPAGDGDQGNGGKGGNGGNGGKGGDAGQSGGIITITYKSGDPVLHASTVDSPKGGDGGNGGAGGKGGTGSVPGAPGVPGVPGAGGAGGGTKAVGEVYANGSLVGH